MTFRCFGTTCSVECDDPGAARRALEDWHARFSRFLASSELSRVNADPRETAPVSADMARLVSAVVAAAEATDGLVDGTLAREIALAGYRTDHPLPLPLALRLAPPRRPARPRGERWWDAIDVRGGAVRRPPGMAFDSGGLAKGLFADLLAERFAGGDFVFDCGGDLRVGGRPRTLHVADPFGGPPAHAFELSDGAVATSGIGRRSWLGARGPAHHLLDPATGRPAYTGVVQATALAPTAVEAEWRAKAALLSGPDGALDWLSHGGVVVLDDGSARLAPAATRRRGGRHTPHGSPWTASAWLA